MVVTTLIVLAVIILTIMIWFTRESSDNLLPGPIGLPIVGYLPFMTKKPHVKLCDLAKTYGSVYNLRIGARNIVVLCGYKAIKDALNQPSFIERLHRVDIDPGAEIKKPSAFADVPWKHHRKFTIRMLKSLGFGRALFDEHLKEEILELLYIFEKHSQAPFNLRSLLMSSVANNIASLLFGKRLKYDDPVRVQLDSNHIKFDASEVNRPIIFPWLNFVMRKILRKTEDDTVDFVEKLIKKEVDDHEKNIDFDNVQDIVDNYFLEIQKSSNDPDQTFNRSRLEDMCSKYFKAGSEPVCIAVENVMLICAVYQNVQRKMQIEIDAAFGTDEFPSYQDRAKTPYTEATIFEVMRCVLIPGLKIMRHTLEDSYVNGHLIRQHTPVMAVLYSISHDRTLWGDDVEDFRPERFLSEDGRTAQKPEFLTPFSIGKRQCSGKPLAELEVYIYVVSILRKFNISVPSLKGNNFDTLKGMAHKLDFCFKPRTC